MGLAAATMLLCACSSPRQVDVRLAERAYSADMTSPTFTSLWLAKQDSWPLDATGFLDGVGTPGAGDIAVQRRAQCRLPGGIPGRLWIMLDMRPLAERQACRALFSIGGRPQTHRINMPPGRRQYLLPLGRMPHGGLQSLVFREPRSPATDGAPRVAAAVYGEHIFRATDPMLAALRERPVAPLDVDVQDGTPRVRHLAPSALAFALKLRPHSHFLAEVAAESARLRLSVTLAAVGGRRQTLWTKEVDVHAPPMRIELALPAEDDPIEVILEASPLDPTKAGRAIWLNPRIESVSAPASADTDRGRRMPAPAERVIIVVLDAARAASSSAYGSTRDTTPHLRALAEEGVLFENAFTSAVFTRGSMASVWTSRPYDEHHRGLPDDAVLPKEFPTLAQRLSRHGVQTIGIVANGNAGLTYGVARGFRHFEILRGKGHPPNADQFPLAVRRFIPQLRAARRSLLYLHFREPHSPYRPPPPYNTRFGPDAPLEDVRAWVAAVVGGRRTPSVEEVRHFRRLYDANLAYADSQVGKVRSLLEEAGLWQKSAVIVTADHGEALYEGGFIGHNNTLIDSCTRVPLVIRAPGCIRGARIDSLVSLLDIAPTTLALLGIDDADFEARGVSLMPALRGEGFRGEQLVVSRTTGDRGDYAVQGRKWKYVRKARYGIERLYAMESGTPGEQDAAMDPVRAAYYRQALQSFLFSCVRPTPLSPAIATLSGQERQELKALGYLE